MSLNPAQVDINILLAGLAAKSGEELDWKHSVTDLLKTLGADFSLAGREKLAADIGWSEEQISQIGTESGDQSLHSAVLSYLAAHGGKLPT
jgi:hypothetical protein